MKRSKSFFWHLFPYFMVIVIASVGAVTWYAYSAAKKFYLEQVALDLRARAQLVTASLAGLRPPLQVNTIDEFCDRLGQASGTRVTFILPSGTVLGDSERDPLTMDNHADRPEVVQALKTGVGSSQRYSFTLGKYMMYVAVPYKEDGHVAGIIRTSLPIASIGSALRRPLGTIVVAAFVVLVVAVFASLFASRKLAKPLSEMEKVAIEMARGDLDTRIALSGPEEISRLGGAVNAMASALKQRITTITEQKDRLQAILSIMHEGVVALDSNDRISSINKAAANMLGVDEGDVLGRTVLEAIRNTDLQSIISQVKETNRTQERTITLQNVDKRLRVRATPVRADSGNHRGMVLVLYDVSKMERLEMIRQEFVANVSHELKTPITAIKAAVETLQELLEQGPEEAGAFVGIIRRHSERLEALVEDLLALSRLEQGPVCGPSTSRQVKISRLLSSAIAACREAAESRSIKIRLRCADSLEAKVIPRLLEQAVINLIDNAIKYSEEGSEVNVEAEAKADGLEIRVKDQGYGIDKKHLPRIFERFYRVDKARSRARGGTGLGLAIVKHVAQVHGGEVAVKSKIGQGSTFSIFLPS